MKAAKYLSLALALSFTAALVTPPAEAQNLDRILRNALGGRSGNRPVANQAMIRNNIDVGISKLQMQIQTDMAAGRISPFQASQLNAQLGNLMALRDRSLSMGGYTATEVQQILSAFQQMNTQIASYQNTANQFGYPYNQYNNLYNRSNPYDYRYNRYGVRNGYFY